jgi:hypothetical protein
MGALALAASLSSPGDRAFAETPAGEEAIRIYERAADGTVAGRHLPPSEMQCATPPVALRTVTEQEIRDRLHLAGPRAPPRWPIPRAGRPLPGSSPRT